MREEVSGTIAQLKARGIKTIMITGDDQATADAVAQSVGIDQVLAQIRPQDKALHVRELQSHNQTVAMVGDGVQDASALAAADVGIAFCRGIDGAPEIADIALLREDMTLIPKIITQSQGIMRRLYLNVAMGIVYNGIAIPLAMGIWYLLCGAMISPLCAGVFMVYFSLLLMCMHYVRI